MTELSELLRKSGGGLDTELKPKTLSSYLKERGVSTEELERTLADIRGAACSLSPSAPQTAERLAKAGLSDSGYRDYLAGAAEARLTQASAAAYADYLSDKRTAVADYQEYLSKVEDKKAARTAEVYRFADTISTLDEGTVLRYAQLLGFPYTQAQDIAKDAVERVAADRRERVMATVISRNMTAAEADTYARALGCSEEECRRIAAFADEVRRAVLEGIELPIK